jgi:hypothetical protein
MRWFNLIAFNLYRRGAVGAGRDFVERLALEVDEASVHQLDASAAFSG